MPPTYKIAIIQMDMEPVAVAKNFATASRYIQDAASQGAHLAVLPEYHLTSWAPEHADFIAATRESMAYLVKYQSLARDLNINIVPGTICEAHQVGPGDEEIRNMAYFIAAGTGDFCGVYQKKNLWHPERHVLTSSRDSPHEAFDTPLRHGDGRPVRAGLLICWDLAFPEAFRRLVADGAELIIVPAWWLVSDKTDPLKAVNPDAEKVFLENVTVARACENTAAIVFCNYDGLSGLLMPGLGAVSRLPVGEYGMVISEMDLNVLKVAENSYKVRADLAKDGWHYDYRMRDLPSSAK